jgi:hypothetical protein
MSKIGFPKKVLEKNKFAILIYKSPKGLKAVFEKGEFTYSTVTTFAKFFGLSTSMPFKLAM